MSELFGAVEAGGTKFLVAVGDDPVHPREVLRIPTVTPDETLREVVRYFEQKGPVKAIGVATFGPVDYARGCIAKTPKAGWSDFPLKAVLKKAFHVPVAFDTDVNGAALGEARHGAGQGAANFVYFTVGTGIGGGAIASGYPVHGKLHPEMGHLLVRRHAEEPAGFRGSCPFHGDCLEGLASGPAMEARWGVKAQQLPADHAAWRIEADYLAQACLSVALTLSPEAIVLGGGVMEQEQLFPMVRTRLAEMLNGYLAPPEIRAPGLPYPALTGALAMAKEIG